MIGKFKFRTLLVLAAAVLLASCSQDEVMTDTGHDGLVPVTLSAAVGDGVQTRTIDADNDEKPTRCYVQAFTTDDSGTTLTPAPGDLDSPLDMGEPTAEGTFSLANVYLNPNETYVFLYWADNEEKTASALTDLTRVAYTYTRNGNLIAWAERSEAWNYKTAGTAEISAELQHVVAKVTLKTTTNVEAGCNITVTVPTTYTGYNVADETVIQEAINKDTPFEHTVPNAITGTKDGTEVFSFYALVKDETQNITLTNGTNSQQVSNVPLGPNKHTTLVGDVKNLGLTNVTFTANMDTNWGSTIVHDDRITADPATHTITLEAEGLLTRDIIIQTVSDNGELKIVGQMNQGDFETIGESCQMDNSPVKVLDLSEVETQLTALPKNTGRETDGYQTGSVFSLSTNLEEIVLPSSITSLQQNAFRECVKLHIVKAPGVSTLESNIFLDCSTLTDVWLTSDTWSESTQVQANALNNTNTTFTLHLDISQQPYVDEEAKTWTPGGNTTPVKLYSNSTINVVFEDGN